MRCLIFHRETHGAPSYAKTFTWMPFLRAAETMRNAVVVEAFSYGASMSVIVSVLSAIIRSLMPNGLGVFLNEQINDLIDARGSYRVLALIRLNSALAQGEVISQYVYLTGQVLLEHGTHLVDERHLSGRQGRLAFTFLTAERHRPISRHELVSIIWPDAQPREVEVALSAILSKLRAALKKASLSSRDAGIDMRLGSITFRLPGHTWVDIEDAAKAMDQAEGALRKEDRAFAWSFANVVVSITRRPFLANEEAPRGLRLAVGSCECFSSVAYNVFPRLAPSTANRRWPSSTQAR